MSTVEQVLNQQIRSINAAARLVKAAKIEAQSCVISRALLAIRFAELQGQLAVVVLENGRA